MQSTVYYWDVMFLLSHCGGKQLKSLQVRPPREHGASLVPRLAAQERMHRLPDLKGTTLPIQRSGRSMVVPGLPIS